MIQQIQLLKIVLVKIEHHLVGGAASVVSANVGPTGDLSDSAVFLRLLNTSLEVRLLHGYDKDSLHSLHLALFKQDDQEIETPEDFFVCLLLLLRTQITLSTLNGGTINKKRI